MRQSKKQRVEKSVINYEWIEANKSNPIYWGTWVAIENGDLLCFDKNGQRLFSRAKAKSSNFVIAFINENGTQTLPADDSKAS